MSEISQQRAKYTGLAHSGKLTGTIAAALRKWKARQQSKPKPYTTRTLRLVAKRAKPVVVPLGSYDQPLHDVRAKDRRKEWSGVEAGVSGRVYETGDNRNWRKKSTFQRWLVVESWARVHSLRIEYHLHGRVATIPAPRGYRWDSDANGLVLVGRAGDYHPTASELIDAAGDKCRGLIAKLKENAAIRKVAAKKAKQQLKMVRRAEREGARICLADSLRAGNCRAGSTNWARNHNLDPAQHYKPTQVLALANGDASRVAIVAAAAIRRHQQEMQRGYCELAEHKS